MAWSIFGLCFMGGLNGVYQVLAGVKKSKKQDCCFSRQVLRAVCTFLLITFAWLFFRAGSLSAAKEILGNLFSVNNWTILFGGELYTLGVAKNEMSVLIISIITLFIVDYYKYKEKDVVGFILRQEYWFRYLVYAVLFFVILIHGCYGETYDAQQFIYFQF